jgi:hypothetical protein|tara:strand:+ start:845 stop:1330 length:486 start_codon:yes stop_codon:yes gene_type:complete
MAIQVVDNFLDKQDFINIKNMMLGNQFPWFYHNYVSDKKETDKFYFNHNFYKDEKPQSIFFDSLKTLIDKLEVKSLIRVKGNLHTKADKMTYNNFHIDLPFKHKGCLLYINNNNGYTFFKESDKEVKPKENRVVLFDPSIDHKSSRCSDSKVRINININYF